VRTAGCEDLRKTPRRAFRLPADLLDRNAVALPVRRK
jgi:hypothetical protein